MRTLVLVIVFSTLVAVLAFLGCARKTDTVSHTAAQTGTTAVSPEAEVKPAPVQAPPSAVAPAMEPAATAPETAPTPVTAPEEQTKQTLEPMPIQTAVPPQPKIETPDKPAETADKPAEPETKAAATDTTEKTAPAKTENAAIAVVGDSLAVGIGMTMQQHVTDYPGLSCDAAGKVSTGLISTKFFDWDKKLAELLAAKKLTAVVVMMGGNDANNSIAGKAAGTPEWGEAYRQKAEDFLKIATNAGVKVLWVGLPVMRDPAFSNRVKSVNESAKQACQAVPGCAYMEPSDAFADAAGKYVQSKDIDGKKVKLRGKDGVHMTMNGYDLLCGQILDRLDKTVGLKTQ